jgi:heterodisulfide reductase subunit B
MRDELKKDVYEHPCHTTCTGIGYHSDIVPVATTMTVVARQFAIMTEAGYENLLPSCITSFGLYTEILDTWHHFPEVEDRVREQLLKATGREFKKPKNLAHASDVIYKFRKEIGAKAKYKLINKNTGEPLKVVDHIGCHYAKMFPSKGVGGAEYPYVLTGMVEEWGGQLVDYPERRHCCGFGFRQYLVQANRGFSIACSKENGEGIPVFTYEEVAGLVLGYDPWDLGLQMHQTDCEPVLDKMGIEYSPEEKYNTDVNVVSSKSHNLINV